MTSPNLSKKEIDNSLYKSFYVVNKTQIERLNLIFKFGGCDCLLLPKCDCLGSLGVIALVHLSLFLIQFIV
jgi:hypothetical protein